MDSSRLTAVMLKTVATGFLQLLFASDAIT